MTPDIRDTAAGTQQNDPYWLGRCEGFRVDSPEGRFGLVEAVMFRVRPDEPDALVVRTGMLGRRLAIVPIEDVERVAPRRKRIVLRHAPGVPSADVIGQLRTVLGRLAPAPGTVRGLGFRTPTPS